MALSGLEDNGYSLLKDLKLEFHGEEDGTFSLSFWLYLVGNPTPATILKQVYPDTDSSVPFLVFDESKKLMLLQLPFLHKETPTPSDSTKWNQVPYASSDIEYPFNEWVHVGCEVCTKFARLYINGEIVGENALSSSLTNNSNSNNMKSVILVGSNFNNDSTHGYVHNARVLPIKSSMKDIYLENSPVQLSINISSPSDMEEDSAGVWNIVGGKGSCCKDISIDVVLLSALGQPVNKDMQIITSFVYEDHATSAEKPNDAEAYLFTSYDGIEFPSCERPSKLFMGRASFILKLSQLPSKYHNKLFRIKFEAVPNMGNYRFLEAFSRPIRCILTTSNNKTSSLNLRKSSHSIPLLNACQMSGPIHLNGSIEATNSSASKRVKSGHEQLSQRFKADVHLEDSENVHLSQNGNNTQAQVAPENNEDSDNTLSDSESIEVKDALVNNMPTNRIQISDVTVFKYCLGGINERAHMLKELAITCFDQELADFAQQVVLYSGCSHHRNQITMAKKLIEEGTRVWDTISQNSDRVHWETTISYIESQFKRIACCNSRSLSQQDFEILRRVAGCRDYMARENFEKLWCWLYPLAVTLSRAHINTMWASTSPKWIEGFVTKEEAEFSLQGPRGLQDPGTFILRFPTSRSWPHPDAGSLVVTYVGSEYTLRHRLLSLEFINSLGLNSRPLHEMLLAEPELSRLGRITRSY